MECLLQLLNAGRPLQQKTWEKRERNAEIYRRYLAGEHSIVLAPVCGFSNPCVRSIIDRERKRYNRKYLSACPPLSEGAVAKMGHLAQRLSGKHEKQIR